MFKLNDLVHSALYKFGRVVAIQKKIEGENYSSYVKVDSCHGLEGMGSIITVQWNKVSYGQSSYDSQGHPAYSQRTYPTLQLIDTNLTLPEKYLAGEVMAEEEISADMKIIEKWQTSKMDEYFKIPKRKI